MVTVYKPSDLNYIRNNKDYNEYIKKYDKTEIDFFINNYNFLKKQNENFKCILNKITDKNFKIINKQIIELVIKCKGDDEKIKELFDNIKEISIIQYNLSHHYINIILSIKEIININENINKIIQEYFSLINNINIEQNYDNYNDLCEINKKHDYLLGYTLFVAKLELNGIINGYINVVIDKLLVKLFNNNHYIFINCLYELFKILNKTQTVKYISSLNKIKNMQTIKKHIFKIDDILELISL